MKLSKLLIGLSLALGFVATTSAQTTTMRISISVAQNSHQGIAIDTFAKEVEKRTAGRYKVQTFYAGALGGERESIEAVQLGTQELAFSSTGPIPNFVPETKILDVPFLFRDKPHARAVLDGPIGQDLLTKFDAKGFKALAWAENGVRHMTNSKRDVKVPEDLKGLKMRTMENPVHIAAYKGLGIVTTPMAFPEVFTALQQGTVDGQENPLSVIMSAKFDQVQKHLSLTGHVYSPAIFVMNKAAFDKLSAADKTAFIEAAKEGTKLNRARVDQDDATGVTELRAKGMTVTENVDKAKFVAMLAPVNAEFEKQFGKANLDAIRAVK
jgi:TRAP-type transport system periplasmic protein